MSGVLTSYYDPDDPPEPDRMDECDRLLGVSFGRGLIFFIFLTVAGGDVTRGAHSILQLLQGKPLYGVVGIGLLLWTLFPVVQGLEHLVIDTKNAIGDLR